MFCPYVSGECKGGNCRFWCAELSDCMIAIDYEQQINFIVEERKNIQSGLIKVNRELSEVLNREFLRSIYMSPTLSDDDRELLNKLNKKREHILEDKKLEGLYGD